MLVLIDRSNKNVLIKDNIISQVKFKIDTYKKVNFLIVLKKFLPTKPGSINLSK